MDLLARRHEFNQWLNEHPVVLGGVAIAVGLWLLVFGLPALVTGRTRSNAQPSPTGRLRGFLLVFAGLCACLFGLLQLVVGLLS
jgi:hypothetical protein